MGARAGKLTWVAEGRGDERKDTGGSLRLLQTVAVRNVPSSSSCSIYSLAYSRSILVLSKSMATHDYAFSLQSASSANLGPTEGGKGNYEPFFRAGKRQKPGLVDWVGR